MWTEGREVGAHGDVKARRLVTDVAFDRESAELLEDGGDDAHAI